MSERATYTLIVGWELCGANKVKLRAHSNGKVAEMSAARIGGFIELQLDVPVALDRELAMSLSPLRRALERAMHPVLQQWQDKITPKPKGEGAE